MDLGRRMAAEEEDHLVDQASSTSVACVEREPEEETMSERKDLRTAIEDLKKTVGDVLLPPLERWVIWLNDQRWVNWLSRMRLVVWINKKRPW